MIKIAIAGIGGRMGRSLYDALQQTTFDMVLTEATALPDDNRVGQPVSTVFFGESQVLIADRLSGDFDILVDFTAVQSTLAHVAYCRENNKAIVVGTTGFNQQQVEQIHQAAKEIPVFMSANMSVGVNVMQQLVSIATKALHQQADIEIIEAHHKHKVDAPSGTALMLGQAIAESMGVNLSDKGVFAREGITGARQSGTIGFSTIRGGDVVGEHTTGFYMAGERVEISHRATDRQIFARGALFAANYLAQQSPGLYNMSDALGI